MKKHLLTLIFCITSLMATQAQEYKVSKSDGKMIVNFGNVLVEGYNGKEIIFTSQHKEAADVDPKAKGLRIVHNGYIDNTGLGINIVDKGDTLKVEQVVPDRAIKILVPKGVIVAFVCHTSPDSAKLVCRNLENEIEIETDYNDVLLENVTGPIIVRTLYGAVDVIFSEHIKGPVYIAAVHSAVDVTIPGDTKANVILKSSFNSILTSPALNMEMEKRTADDSPSYASFVKGKLNGGGFYFRLDATYGKIYLRKK
jgi:hypothetical protein